MSPTFIHDDFLLASPAARRLYHDHAAGQPILDFHNHLPQRDIADDRRFENLYEPWLEGAHYKWRAMRWNGEPEELITADAPPYEKFLAFAHTFAQHLAEYALGRPIGFTDDPLIDSILAQAKADNYNIRTFVQAIVTSQAFQTKR